MTVDIYTEKCTFRGVYLPFKSIRAILGNKTATHEFFQTKDRIIETLGGFPEKFTFSEFDIGQYSDSPERGKDVILSLINVLNDPSVGQFVHPILGKFNVKLEGQYSLTYDIQSIETAKFNFTLSVSSEEGSPLVNSNGFGNIQNNYENIQNILIANIFNSFSKPTTISTQQAYIEIYQSYVSIVQSSISILLTSVERNILIENTNIISINVSLYSLNGGIVTQFNDNIEQFNDYSFADTGFRSCIPLIEFKPVSSIANQFGLSGDQVFRKYHIDNFVLSTKISGLINAYKFTADEEFLLENSVQERIELLETYYNEIIQDWENLNQFYNTYISSSLNISYTDYNEIIKFLNKMRSDVIIRLKTGLSDVYRIGTVRDECRTPSLISYYYYGNDEFTRLIYSLNKNQNKLNLSGDISILERI